MPIYPDCQLVAIRHACNRNNYAHRRYLILSSDCYSRRQLARLVRAGLFCLESSVCVPLPCGLDAFLWYLNSTCTPVWARNRPPIRLTDEMDTRAPRARAAWHGVCARWGAACVWLSQHPDAGRLKAVPQLVLAHSCARGVVVTSLAPFLFYGHTPDRWQRYCQ